MSIDWGRYKGLSVRRNIGGITFIDGGLDRDRDQVFSNVNQKYAIAYRDELISVRLAELGCEKLVDFGCDFGSLLFHAELKDICAVGVEPDPVA
jgi:hypothetical protein